MYETIFYVCYVSSDIMKTLQFRCV